MSKRLTIKLLVTAAAAVVLAVTWGLASGSSSASASATKLRVVPIVMKDPGCHWFHVAGKDKIRLVVHGKTAFRNLDEAALTFKGKGGYLRHVPVGKTLTVAKTGTYRIKMVHQHPDDNTLVLVVK